MRLVRCTMNHLSVYFLLQMHKQKLQVVTAQGQQTTVTQQPQQVQAAPTPQTSAQLTAVATVPRAGAGTVLTGTTAPSLQVARLVSSFSHTLD